MIDNKILIFSLFNFNINSGGPSGFLAQNLIDKPRDFFVFPQDLIFPNRFRNILKNYINDKFLKKEKNYLIDIFKESNAKNYKYIFFHDCATLFKCRDLIQDHQIVILQSHSPELPSKESKEAGASSDYIAFLQQAEQYSFQRANYIVFPSEGAVNIYRTLNFDEKKVRLILSGCKNIDLVRKDYPLENKINLFFIGRRNKVKGFDIVLESFKRAVEVRDDINLIIAGGGDEIKYKNVYDLGFINNPLDWYHNADYVINANRQSYFDLSILEALSVGARLIMTTNFGHSFFKGTSEDILEFDAEDANGLYNVLTSEKLTKKILPSNLNKELYQKHFTDQLYYERLKSFFQKLRNE